MDKLYITIASHKSHKNHSLCSFFLHDYCLICSHKNHVKRGHILVSQDMTPSAILLHDCDHPPYRSDLKASGLSAVDHIICLRLFRLHIQLNFLEISGIFLQVKLPNILSDLDELLAILTSCSVVYSLPANWMVIFSFTAAAFFVLVVFLAAALGSAFSGAAFCTAALGAVSFAAVFLVLVFFASAMVISLLFAFCPRSMQISDIPTTQNKIAQLSESVNFLTN